jgi:hypothetical protein
VREVKEGYERRERENKGGAVEGKGEAKSKDCDHTHHEEAECSIKLSTTMAHNSELNSKLKQMEKRLKDMQELRQRESREKDDTIK